MTQDHTSQRGNQLTWVLWLLAIGVSLYAVFGPYGFLDLEETRAERQRLEQRIAELETENRRLRERIRKLEEDPAYLERRARERLGMVKPDERVVIVPERQR